MLSKLFNAHFKEFYRQDQIYKKIIRRLVRVKRTQFKRFVMRKQGHEVRDNAEAEHLLLLFLSVKYQITRPISKEELQFAKSTVYTFGAKTREAPTLQEQRFRVRELRNQFLEKGTQKEAEKFFVSEVGFKLFYHDFVALLIFGNQRCNQNNNWKVIYGFKKLMKKMLGHQSFKDMLEKSVGNIYEYLDNFPKVYESSY